MTAVKALRYPLLTLLALLFISPLVFMVVTSFKNRAAAAPSTRR